MTLFLESRYYTSKLIIEVRKSVILKYIDMIMRYITLQVLVGRQDISLLQTLI